MRHCTTEILLHEPIAREMRELRFRWPEDAGDPVPGQFLTIRSTSGTDPLLRRPFAFSSWDPEQRVAGIIYQKRGKATELLASKDIGDTLDIVGPLGNVFPEPSADRRPVLIGGGIGLGPILFLADRLARAGRSPLLVIGARTAEFLPSRSLGAYGEVVFSTDDGSRGVHGTAIDAVTTAVGTTLAGSEFYACGPNRMLAAVRTLAASAGSPCWVSMEQTMGCGVGACMGCVIRVNDERMYARVCMEGPVFPAETVVWEQ